MVVEWSATKYKNLLKLYLPNMRATGMIKFGDPRENERRLKLHIYFYQVLVFLPCPQKGVPFVTGIIFFSAQKNN